MGASKSQTALFLLVIVILYVLFVVFACLSVNENHRSLFPNTTFEVNREYHLEITPVDSTYSIWCVIFAYTILWLGYAITTTLRNGENTNVISAKFYSFFLLNVIFMLSYIFTWSRSQLISSFILMLLAQLCIDVAFYFLCVDIKEYQEKYGFTKENSCDLWSLYLLVQNGVLFYGSWTTFVTLLSAATVFKCELGATSVAASHIALAFLTVILILWYFLENFAFQEYTSHTFGIYVAYIWGLSGIFANAWHQNESVGGFVLGLLILTLILIVVRIIILALRNTKRITYENIGYDAENQAIKKPIQNH